MIYLVTKNHELFENSIYKIISLEDSIKELENWDVIQFDTETSGRDAHICDILCAQFGNKTLEKQIVVDCSCIDIKN